MKVCCPCGIKTPASPSSVPVPAACVFCSAAILTPPCWRCSRSWAIPPRWPALCRQARRAPDANTTSPPPTAPCARPAPRRKRSLRHSARASPTAAGRRAATILTLLHRIFPRRAPQRAARTPLFCVLAAKTAGDATATQEKATTPPLWICLAHRRRSPGPSSQKTRTP